MSLIILATPSAVFAQGGHSHEFQGASEAKLAPDSIQVAPQTAKRLGIKVDPVTRQQLPVSVNTTGQIETLPDQKAEVTAPLNSTVVELLVKPGDLVKKGQPVAVISSPEVGQLRVESQEKQVEGVADLQQAEADLNLAQQKYQQYLQIAAAEIEQAKSQVAFAQEKYDRDKELVDAGVLSRRSALESQTKLAEARAALTKAASRKDVLEAEAQLKRAHSAVEVAKSRIRLSNATYQTRLQQLGSRANAQGLVTVTAPIAGTVTEREAALGQSFQDAGGKLMTITNDNQVFATGNIHEKDLDKIAKGQKVNLRVVSLPDKTFIGRISQIGSLVERETRVVPVQAELDNSLALLKPGMFVELEILTASKPTSILVVPSSAVVEANGKNLVFVQNGDAYQPVEVSVGQTVDNLVEIKSGLFDGDMIVTRRAFQLYAQSFRESKAVGEQRSRGAEEDEKKAEEVGEKKKESALNPKTSVPRWVVGTGGGVAIAATAFMVGAFWSGRRTSHKLRHPNNHMREKNAEGRKR